jgi:hypothetical protein
MPQKVVAPDFNELFHSQPGLYLILNPDLVIVNASEEYLEATLSSRRDIIGCYLFDMFPNNPNDPEANGAGNLRASLARCGEHGGVDQMPVQKYDVQDRVAKDKTWVEKYWAPRNLAVRGRDSAEVTHLVHQVEDLTETIELGRWVEEQLSINTEQLASVERMRQDLLHRRRGLEAAIRAASSHARSPSTAFPGGLCATRIELGAPDIRRYLRSGERASVSGVYRTFHHESCERPSKEFVMRIGDRLFPCPDCRTRMRYRLERRLRV